jgi:DNA-binding MarR family transcriptional regulator
VNSFGQRSHLNQPKISIPFMSNLLYTYCMKTLGKLLTSEGKTEILRVLVYQSEPVGLRQAARLARIHPHSAEVALSALVGAGLVKYRRSPHRARYELVRNHEDVAVLEAVFQAATNCFIAAQRRTLDERARQLLPFIKQTVTMIARARESHHVA